MKPLYIILEVYFTLWLLLPRAAAQDRNVKVMDYPDQSERKTALVIGNGAYAGSPLDNPLNDATDMQKILTALGFQVDKKLNASRSEMIAAIRAFGDQLRGGGVGLFFYAGHGIQVDGQNYLIPKGADVRRKHEVDDETVNVGRVLGEMAEANNRLNIVILDACRDNPFRGFRGIERGLALMNAPGGTLIAYATAPGRTADDGPGSRNSPYTTALLNQIKKPGLKIEEVFKQVRIEVLEKTNHAQEPWESTSLRGDFYFIPPAFSSQPPVKTPTPQTSPPASPSRRIAEFRSTPLSNLESESVIELVKRWGFYDKYRNPSGIGFTNDYEAQTLQGDTVVIDHASGLMWQQSGSDWVSFREAQTYVDNLNAQEFASFSDWRLPTLEEVMSLMEPKESENGLYINPLFDAKQSRLWIADRYIASEAWGVDFNDGNCYALVVEGSSECVRAVRSSAGQSPVRTTTPPASSSRRIAEFRSTPLSNLESARELVKLRGFYERGANPSGKGFANDCEAQTLQGDKVVIDHASGLMWQQSGSKNYMYFEDAQAYIDSLNGLNNGEGFAGSSDWRLPTLEEAMSLIEPKKSDKGLYIDSLFDTKQRCIWTADRYSASDAWYVDFNLGYCTLIDVVIVYFYYVRAVRSG